MTSAPKVDLPFAEAVNDLTGFEVIGIQRHYDELFENLGGIRSMIGAIWAYENRREKVAWSAVEAMSLNNIQSYFAEPTSDPESDQGKESPRVTKKPTG